ncbi:uncharacterized protein [Diadema antillarum]|uniref:uncharacterized protein isoform X1 n=1 Tax=Diadema antillarum TaxID=105358 RepID=UPI003A87C3CD
MPNLTTLELRAVNIADGFFLALNTSASEARLELIKHSGGPDISAAASEAYAKSICTMPNLKTLELEGVNIADGFFLALKTSASEARLELIKHSGGPDISAAASEAYAKSICTMPNLKTLELRAVNIADGFFLALKTSASEARLELIKHSGGPDISAAASEAYAKSICTMPNLTTLELRAVNIADGFFLALKTSASEARLDLIRHSGGPDISAAASEAYAKSICTMPNLTTLELRAVNIADGFFLALNTSASEARLELIRHSGGPDISAAASEAYAKSICTMPNLKTLELEGVNIADGFFLALKTSASEARLGLIRHSGGPDISAAGSEAYAKSICTMPNLKTLELEGVNIADGFFLALKTSASEARLGLIRHSGGPDISAAGSEAYAKSICTMPNLKTLELEGVNIADGFFLALKTSASEARLELIKHSGGPDISAAASEAYAKSICTMPNLNTLVLRADNIPDGFFLALKTSASEARLELIKHYGRLDISAAASEAYVKSICTMPNLRTLELQDVNIADGFFLALETSASEARLESIKHSGGPDISAAASEAYAKSICTMPNLKTLELEEVNIAHGFFLALKTSASEARLELIRHYGRLGISAAASEAYAKSICTMPNLKTLELEEVNIADGFFLALKTSASEARLELMKHYGRLDISAAASEAYVKSICTMPNLWTLELEEVNIADGFFLALKTSASEARLELIRHYGEFDISAAASEAYAKSICTMPNLETLELEEFKIADGFFLALKTSASEARVS